MKKLSKKERKIIYINVANIIKLDYNIYRYVCNELDFLCISLKSNYGFNFPELKLFNDNDSEAFLSYCSTTDINDKYENMKVKEIVMLLCAEMCND